jgi:hypothetical protein
MLDLAEAGNEPATLESRHFGISSRPVAPSDQHELSRYSALPIAPLGGAEMRVAQLSGADWPSKRARIQRS